ncbi:unnamed protein product [Bursaphelenchus xylophilus]|uniref:(pine wood nematode) hypothetical protein n=1 Tax=Bursaphelenchus xylophilus TaxID=6326 RepID=A0A7I8XH45_BURXY|nr:unnamed protein product [Bursaphelenchus xylophilus]CAG9079628.1 unnamed protein product [Bursaphelenchus xylophilus]
MFLVTLLMNDQQALNMRKIVSIPCLEMMWNLTQTAETMISGDPSAQPNQIETILWLDYLYGPYIERTDPGIEDTEAFTYTNRRPVIAHATAVIPCRYPRDALTRVYEVPANARHHYRRRDQSPNVQIKKTTLQSHDAKLAILATVETVDLPPAGHPGDRYLLNVRPHPGPNWRTCQPTIGHPVNLHPVPHLSTWSADQPAGHPSAAVGLGKWVD